MAAWLLPAAGARAGSAAAASATGRAQQCATVCILCRGVWDGKGVVGSICHAPKPSSASPPTCHPSPSPQAAPPLLPQAASGPGLSCTPDDNLASFPDSAASTDRTNLAAIGVPASRSTRTSTCFAGAGLIRPVPCRSPPASPVSALARQQVRSATMQAQLTHTSAPAMQRATTSAPASRAFVAAPVRGVVRPQKGACAPWRRGRCRDICCLVHAVCWLPPARWRACVYKSPPTTPDRRDRWPASQSTPRAPCTPMPRVTARRRRRRCGRRCARPSTRRWRPTRPSASWVRG